MAIAGTIAIVGIGTLIGDGMTEIGTIIGDGMIEIGNMTTVVDAGTIPTGGTVIMDGTVIMGGTVICSALHGVMTPPSGGRGSPSGIRRLAVTDYRLLV